MRCLSGCRKMVVGAMLGIILTSASSSAMRCDDVMSREPSPYINVLTINLLFSEVQQRTIRLERIADFVAANPEPIDFILLQETVGGPLAETHNSSRDLNSLLAARGIEYNLRYRLANGIPGILTVGNAILSRCEIVFTLGRSLPFVTEEPFDGFIVPLRRQATMSRADIPGFGRIHVYNTHLCAFCEPEERLLQARVLLSFLENVEHAFWGENPIILGGDFNTSLTGGMPGEADVYDLITDQGFIDTFRVGRDCIGCCSAAEGFEGCTFAVPGNPFAVNLFTGEQEEPVRIDYIFVRGFDPEDIRRSTVVFGSEMPVSDHSGALTKIGLEP